MTRTMLAKKFHRLYPPSTRLVPMSLRDMFTRDGHRRIHDLSMSHDFVHYHSASSFFLGTECLLEGKTIVLEGVPYVRNLHSLANGLLPAVAEPILGHALLPKLATRALHGLSFDDVWYDEYLENLVRLSKRNRVYVIHSKTDRISLYSDAIATIDRMQCAGVCILDDAAHHAYGKHPEYARFVGAIREVGATK